MFLVYKSACNNIDYGSTMYVYIYLLKFVNLNYHGTALVCERVPGQV